MEDANASRPLIVTADKDIDKKGRFIQVFSSKLSSIFEAEEEVLDIIEAAETFRDKIRSQLRVDLASS